MDFFGETKGGRHTYVRVYDSFGMILIVQKY